MRTARFPAQGQSEAEVESGLRLMRARDRDAFAGIRFARRFHAGDDIAELAARTCALFAGAGRASHYPGLPALPSMARIQADLEAWSLELVRAPAGAVALLTSGGTESAILALREAWIARRKALPPGSVGEVIAAATAHPCIDKAAELLGLRLIRVPARPDHRADPAAMAAATGPATVMLYASAPAYANGLCDDVPAIATIARAHGVRLHVDGSMGALLAPFQRMNGDEVPDFDLSVPGVASISGDWHKHGYAAKGAAVLVLRDGPATPFAYAEHPLPPMITDTLAGTAPGAPLASAWAVATRLGAAGYCALAAALGETRTAFAAAIARVPGFAVLGDPRFSLMLVTSNRHDMAAVHAAMARSGWFTLLSHAPAGLHLNLNPGDAALAADFARDLQSAARTAA
ncbi:aminotransferase class V-fold PLP-dependent enzyme [Sphingomonas canadensis]|uniref:Aminotransferase class V-fold PLP-dependent enzyme n=1 Tax=Sphingomonas canadensis TaxID=1219257 RepID=A0ABW3HA84_9SPHN|nr:aminotransferase class V-fold PLP-dependent enzyme [Sphingomonas canadensis]MCW3838103.1 aminotransferase class V-fold PLP-dependent enzyme [Sphingomonas canadensis]